MNRLVILLFLILVTVCPIIAAEAAMASGTSIAFAEILRWVLATFGTVFSLFVVAVIVKIFKKMGIELDDQSLGFAMKAIKIGITNAENWAKTQSEKPSSDSKLKKAIEIAEKIAETTGAKSMVVNYGSELVEDYLEENGLKNKLTEKN